MSRSTKILMAVLVVGGLCAAGIVFLHVHSQTARLVRAGLRTPPADRQAAAERMARALRELGEARDAAPADRIPRLTRIVESYPGTQVAQEARLDLAKAQAAAGDVESARAGLAAVMEGQVEGRLLGRALLVRAGLLAASDEPAARRDLERVAGGFRQYRDLRAKAIFALGVLDLKQGLFDRAIERLAFLADKEVAEQEEALKLIRDASLGRAQKLAEQGDWRGVADLCERSERMVAKFPELASLGHTLRFRQAEACRHLGRFADARNVLERLLRDVPKEARDPALDLPTELAALTQAEDAAGGRRSREAFLQARREGKEPRQAFEGEVAADATWGKDKSPLVLTGVVTVKAGATLTIEAGVVVQFLLGARLVAEGALVAVGTADQPVRFTSAAGPAASCFDGEGIELVPSGNPGASRLEQCVIEFQRVGLTCRRGTAIVRRCTLTRNGKDALAALEGAEPQIEECVIEGNDGGGVRSEKANPAIRRSRISQNGHDGIVLLGKSSPAVEACRVVRNGGEGIACDNFAAATIRGCEVAENRGNGISCSRFSNATLQGNVIRRNEKVGISCERESAATVLGNLIEGNAAGGIELSQSSGAIKANTIAGQKGFGIHCTNASPAIEENWIEGNYGPGVVCDGSSAPAIKGNAIVGHRLPISHVGTAELHAEGNYLGPGSEEELDGLLASKEKMKVGGTVLWRPRLTQPPARPARPAAPDVP